MRFNKYKQVGELEADLTGHLGAQSSSSWRFVHRANAASGLPTDFALLLIPAVQLQKVQQQLLSLIGFKDMHPDKKITGRLKWSPEGALAGAFVDASLGAQTQQQQQQRQKDVFWETSPGRDLLQSPPEAASTNSQPTHSSSSSQQGSEDIPPPAPSPQPSTAIDPDGIDAELDPDSIFYTTKPPGRFTTKPTIGLDQVEGKDELRRRRSSSRRRARQLLQDETPADAVTKLLKAQVLWDQGYSGKGIKVS